MSQNRTFCGNKSTVNEHILRHITQSTVINLSNEISYQPGQIVSKTLVQNEAVGLTLFAFDQGEQISTHEASGDALVTILDGVGRITLDSTPHEMQTGESIIIPARTPHAVFGVEQFKMALLVVYPATQ